MKYKNLKRVLAIALLASSSLAFAEGKFAYQLPINGVKASPTFGMTENEKQDWKEEQENIAMCLNENSQSGSYYNREANNENFFLEEVYRGKSGYMVTTEYREQVVMHDGNVIGSHSGNTPSNALRNEYRGDSVITENSNSGYPRTEYNYYKINIEDETENYDWCVTNGYDTEN